MLRRDGKGGLYRSRLQFLGHYSTRRRSDFANNKNKYVKATMPAKLATTNIYIYVACCSENSSPRSRCINYYYNL